MPAVLVAALLLTAPQANAEFTRITDREAVDGSDYTDSPAMAEKLNDIFDGNASIYRDLACTRLVETPLGSSPVKNNGVYMFVDPVEGIAKNIGTSCWIYANGVYYTLFGESTGNGIGENSEKLSLTGSRSLTYNNLKAWGVRQGVGALIRASGHSMIVLDYDADTLTVLDGNSDGCGLVCINERSWDRLGNYVEYIIQPTDAHYADLFACGMCGENAAWSVDDEGTLTISGSGSIAYPDWRNYNEKIKKVIIQDKDLQLGSGIFYNCENLEEIVFQAGAPTFADNAFLGVTATIHYPAPKPGWSEDILQTYGGEVTWEPYGMTQLKIITQPTLTEVPDTEGADVTITAEGDGLRYSWYVKPAGEALYLKTSGTGPVYRVQPMSGVQELQVMCMVTDQYGNFLNSESLLITQSDSVTAPVTP